MPDIERERSHAGTERSRDTGIGPARPFDFVFLLRPALMVPLWIFFAQGARLASHRGWWFETVVFPGVREWLGLLAITGILGGGYLLNQIVDIETDRLNDKLFFLPRGIISGRSARVELAIVWIAAIAVALVLGTPFLWVAVAALALSVTYSSRPVRAKTRGGLDVVWNSVGFGLTAVLAGLAATRAPGAHLVTGGAVWSLVSYAAAVAGVTASTIVLDRDGDRRTGLRTTAVVIGERATSLLGVALLASAFAFGLIANDIVAVTGSAVSFALAVRAHRRADRASRIGANQLGVAAFAFAASVFSPYLLVLLVIVTLGSRLYYRRRFGLVYPGPDSQ